MEDPRRHRRVVLLAGVLALLFTLSGASLATSHGLFASFNVNPTGGDTDTVFVADATRSTGNIVKYEWDWTGNGTFVEGGRVANHTYSEDGLYGIVLRVTDDQNRTATSTPRYVQVGEGATRAFFEWDAMWRAMPALLQGALITLQLAVTAILLGLPLGILFALGRVSRHWVLQAPAFVWVTVLRGTPLLVQIFISFFVVRPLINTTFGLEWGAYEAGLLAFVANTSAYQAEIIRAGIQAIPSGQMEAAYAMGMTYRQGMRHIVLPQAFRLILPPLTNEFIVLVKDTSLVVAIGMTPPELLGSGRFIISRTQDVFEIYIGIALIYLALTFTLSRILVYLERRFRIPGLGIDTPGGGH